MPTTPNAGACGCVPTTRVYRIRRRPSRQRPERIIVEDVSLPAALFPDLIEKKGASDRIIGLAQQYGVLLGKAEERISIEQASPAVAQLLGIAAAAPVMVLDRVVMILDGRPIEWRVGRCHLADKYYRGGDDLTQAHRPGGLLGVAEGLCNRARSWSSMSHGEVTTCPFRKLLPRLTRFTVLDLTRVRAGPTAARQLADWGANVIKVELPEHQEPGDAMGGPRHGPDFQNLHRNKRGDHARPQVARTAWPCSAGWRQKPTW